MSAPTVQVAPVPTGEPLMAVVVVNYGSTALLRQNLGRLDLGGLPVRVVVVDNWSTPEERAAVTELARISGWSLVPLPDNRGFGAGVNAGVAAARAAGCVCSLLLNPDAAVDQEVLAELRRAVLDDPDCLVSPRVVGPDGAVWFDGAVVQLDTGRIRSVRPGAPVPIGAPWLTGACLAVHHDLFDRLGGLAEDYFLYWEDVDLSVRAAAAGARLVVRHDLVAVHDAGGTQGPRRGRAKSAVYYRWNCRNRLAFAAARLPRRRLARWVLATPAVSREVLLRGGRRQLLTQPQLLWAAVRGSAEGLALALPALVRRRPTGPRPVLVAHPGAELYGSDRMLAESVAGLVERGHRVLVALPGEGPLVAELERRGAQVTTCPMPVLRKSALTPRGALAMVRDATVGLLPALRLVWRAGGGVHVSTVTIPSWVLLGRLLGRRVTVHVHEAESSAHPLVRIALAVPAVLAHRVLVNSHFSLEVLVRSAPRVRARAVVVSNGVAGPVRRVPPRERLDGPVRLLYVGRLSPRKGPQVAVATLAELVRRGVDARLELAGSVFPGYEWFADELAGQVRAAGLVDRVRFHGFVPDVWQVLAAADVVLVPSVLDEPFGNTAVEAVLAARPVVVSATSGLLEAVAGHRSAQAVPPSDAIAWADAVELVSTDWPRWAGAALQDADSARHRHDPARYRARVAQLTVTADAAALPEAGPHDRRPA